MKLILLLFTLFPPAICFAQSGTQLYAINWSKISGGGGFGSNGVAVVGGTIGQHDASGPMHGGGYAITGGFWSLVKVVQTPGAPLLSINVRTNQVIVSWPLSATGWTLQTRNNLATGYWVDYTGPVFNNRVTNSLAPGNLFFRLRQ